MSNLENKDQREGESAPISSGCYASLVDRLRGIYTIPVNDGAGALNGKDTFTRTFKGLPPIQAKSADAIVELLEMLKRFADYGEQLWDDENFRDGYKKISSGDLVDCRELLRQFGITDFDA